MIIDAYSSIDFRFLWNYNFVVVSCRYGQLLGFNKKRLAGLFSLSRSCYNVKFIVADYEILQLFPSFLFGFNKLYFQLDNFHIGTD
jgi:hypothetical protein